MTIDRLASIVRPPLRGALAYVAGRSPSEVRAQYGLDELLQLGLNEDFRGPLPGVHEPAIAALDEAGRYPDEGYRVLRMGAPTYDFGLAGFIRISLADAPTMRRVAALVAQDHA